ncbi:ras-like small GTPase [Perkinsela sp. CCAP 1560/4]|nr:ras-like small GTPase [Perkinsela sp. CCAP 1560/4]|eukprot:KNH09451.1 ras-like small GTPase [Perkinsela sp. CCAP 1560/4]
MEDSEEETNVRSATQNSSKEPETASVSHIPLVKIIEDDSLRIALVGNMNAGKSTMFNMMMNERIPSYHFVADHDGTTRDAIEAKGKLHDAEFTIVDTPGMINGHFIKDSIPSIQSCDVVLFLTSALSGISGKESKGLEVVRSLNIPVILIVNKIDLVDGVSQLAPDLYDSLGLGDPIYVSLKKRSGIDELYATLLPHFELSKIRRKLDNWKIEEAAAKGDENALNIIEQKNSLDRFVRVAIIGKANSGKSTLFNRITGVGTARETKVPNTTRDSIELKCIYKGQRLKLTDTPSFLRIRQFRDRPFEEQLWKRTRSVIRFANLCIIVFDATQGCPVKGDMILAHTCINEGKAFTFAANKWDLVSDGVSIAEAIDYKMKKQLHEVKYCSAVAISAVTGLNLSLLLDHLLTLYETWNKHITSARLTRFWRRVEKSVTIPHHVTRVRKIVQVNVRPPTFVLHLQTRDEMKQLPYTYEGMIRNHLVEEFGFHGVPIRIFQEVKDAYKDFF